MEIPCKNCLLLPICMGKDELDCKLLLDFFTHIRLTTLNRLDRIEVLYDVSSIFNKEIIVSYRYKSAESIMLRPSLKG